jgi:hypothetical protein
MYFGELDLTARQFFDLDRGLQGRAVVISLKDQENMRPRPGYGPSGLYAAPR